MEETSPDPIFRCLLRSDVSIDSVASRVSEAFEVIRHTVRKQNHTFFDTYVWTLWSQNLVLYKSRAQLILQKMEDGWPVGPVIASAPLKTLCPRFARDFPLSSLRDELAETIACRALRQITELRGAAQVWNLRDKLAKTVARLRISETHSSNLSFAHVELLGLKGYDEEAEKAAAFLAEMAQSDRRGPVTCALSADGLQPTPYILKPALDFLPTQRTRWAVCEAALKTLGVVRANEEGVIADWDSEFLHDFRVSLRRIRSVLSSIKGIFPEENLEAWQDVLRTISRHTNQVRDLDVYLLSQEQMTQLVPSALQSGLHTFFKQVARERTQAFRKLRKYLHSSAYRDAIQFLEDAFQHPENLAPTEHSETPIKDEAAKRIAQRFKKLKRIAGKVHKDAADVEIHKVRIAGKKLRYLLEFFGGLFPSEEIQSVSSLLSDLQSRLGEFNDTSVQQAYLIKSALAQADSLDSRSAMSLGGLIAALYQEHRFLKRKVRRSLKKFRSQASIDAIATTVEKDPDA